MQGERLAAADFGDGGLGNVILGRTEAAGGDDYLIFRHFRLQVAHDGIVLIPDGKHTRDLYPRFFEGAGDAG